MSLSYHLIDGYNLLHAAGLARATYGPGDFERVRFELLIRIAAGLSDAARERATVVFDAFDPPPDAASRFRFRELTVQFAIDAGEADSLIEELIRKHSSPRQLRVVSDDVRLQRAAKRRGGSAVKCDAFLRRLDRFSTPGEDRSGLRADRDRTPEENGDWLAYFGMTEDEAAKEVAKSGGIPGTESSGDKPSAGPSVQSPPTSRRSSSKSAPTAPADRQSSNVPRSPALEAANEEAPVEDLSFWQRRIEDALAEGQLPRRPRPGSS